MDEFTETEGFTADTEVGFEGFEITVERMGGGDDGGGEDDFGGVTGDF